VKLNPEALEVTSFDTSAEEEAAHAALIGPVTSTHPTPRTYCFVCDPATYNCA